MRCGVFRRIAVFLGRIDRLQRAKPCGLQIGKRVLLGGEFQALFCDRLAELLRAGSSGKGAVVLDQESEVALGIGIKTRSDLGADAIAEALVAMPCIKPPAPSAFIEMILPSALS